MVFTTREFESIKSEIKTKNNIRIGIKCTIFTEELINSNIIKITTLSFPSKRETRITHGQFHILGLASTLRKGGYFSHLTAASLMSITTETAQVIYYNYPQPARYSDQELSQDRIDAAFSRPTRVSNTCARFEQWALYLLNSMGSINPGIETIDHPEAGSIRVTNLSRTLIDLAVRPAYGGGTGNVLKLYEQAAGIGIRISEIIHLLNNLDFIYPYRQVIGFYLERSRGCTRCELDRLRELPISFNFYLDNQIIHPAYDKNWQVYYPREFDV
jgi:hypothetical protein